MDAVTRKVLDQVTANQEQLIEDVAGCVRFPSVVGHEGPVQTFMRGLFERLPLDIDCFEADSEALAAHPAFIKAPWPTAGRPNVVGTLQGTDPAARSLALNGHVDVVSPEPISAWKHDPWGAEIVEEEGQRRLYGRGALDMKSGTISCYHALKAVLDAGFRPRGTVSLQSVVEEEFGGGAGTLATLLRGHTADALLNPEPFYRALVLGQPGVMQFRVSLRGKSAHAAQSQLGVNAIGKMIPLYQAMIELDTERAARWPDPFFGGLSDRAVNLCVGTFHAGDWPSTVAGSAAMECRIGFIPPQTMDEVRQEVEARVALVASADPWLREYPPTVEWFDWQAGPWRQDASHPFIQAMAGVVEEVTGARPPLVASTAGLDTRFCGDFGIPAACIGARGADMHGIDEWVDLDTVIETTQILAAAIVEWCGVD
ncbi:MAG TPA: ArgE/DapE family deacylase [Chloroflexota bacterium]|nr:ArgE/DapE family deacylase [Chloroflexota bacterium]